MPIALTAEQLAMAESVGQWASRAGTIASVRGLEASGGVTGGSGPAQAGPAQASWAKANWARAGRAWRVLDRAAARARRDRQLHRRRSRRGRATRRRLAPGPVLPTLLAELALPPAPRDGELLTAIGVGHRVRRGRAVTWHAGRDRDAGRRPAGQRHDRPVLGAGDTSHLLLGAGPAGERGSCWTPMPPGAGHAPHPGRLLARARRRDASTPRSRLVRCSPG